MPLLFCNELFHEASVSVLYRISSIYAVYLLFEGKAHQGEGSDECNRQRTECRTQTTDWHGLQADCAGFKNTYNGTTAIFLWLRISGASPLIQGGLGAGVADSDRGRDAVG